jgi:CRISPR-associated endonuclease/helicase Cas3
LIHDLGKYKPGFQSYLRGEGCRVPHSSVGAIYARQALGMAGLLHAYVVAGHHAGLPDYTTEAAGAAALSARLNDWAEAEFLAGLRDLPGLSMEGMRFPAEANFSVPFYVRMVFSAVTDADFLDAERFYRPDIGSRRGIAADLQIMLDRLETVLAALGIEPGEGTSEELHRLRQETQQACREAAKLPPGLFALNLPTGFGKTLASLVFALRHAIAHGLERVIYVAPYLSIIDQTADVFRRVFNDDVVIEHHSGIDPDQDDIKSRLATENWDAPVVVTTAVQFFESLYGNRSSRCRKLHNIAGAVVILDEAQAVPTECVTPIVHALDQLSRFYRTSVVLTTATQPAFAGKFVNLAPVRDIIPNAADLHAAIRRVAIQWPQVGQRLSWFQVAEQVLRHEQCLTIVDSRRHARALFAELRASGREGVFHLSTYQCPEHRRSLLAEIRQRLEDGLPVQVVSTRLIEAGVDIDFPVVFRSLAGIDSITQAAGRCNREGGRDIGLVVVFIPEDIEKLRHVYPQAKATLEVVGRFGADAHLLPEAIDAYFRLIWWRQEDKLDGNRVLPLLAVHSHQTGGARQSLLPTKEHRLLQYQFASAAEAFRMIDDRDLSVITKYGQGQEVIERLESGEMNRGLLRSAARHAAQVPLKLRDELLALGVIKQIGETGLYAQVADAAYALDLGWVLGIEE